MANNKKTDENKIIKEFKHRLLKREKLAVIFNSIASFSLAIVSAFAGCVNGNCCLVYWVTSGCFALLGFASVILLIINYIKTEKYRDNYKYYSESKNISSALLTAIKRTNYAKTSDMLRSTYGNIPKWNSRDYCKKVLPYDVHEQLRAICIHLKELIVQLSPEFKDDMVTVDISFEYPSDEILFCKKYEKISKSDGVDIDSKNCDIDKTNEESFRNAVKQRENNICCSNNSKWKVITSGDHTSSRVSLLNYLSQSNSFFSYLLMQGYAFGNDKKCLEEKNHYIWSSKDNENNRIGSIVGTVIDLKNDNPEMVFARALLTITTYGRRLVEKDDLLDEKTYEKLFKETVIDSYKTIIEAELMQMFIRHGINNGFINRHTGKIV